LYPPIRYAFLQYSYDNSIPFHDFANHVRSSQLFGINLFYPLLKNEKNILTEYFGNLTDRSFSELSKFEFEYSPEGDWLGEWRGAQRPDEYVTAADIALFFTDKDNRKYAFLIEIKFTEHEFTPCNGFPSKGNQNQAVCNDKDLLFADPNKCYLQTFHPRKSARKYFDKFGDLKIALPNYVSSPESGCPFKFNHQILRNHSFAKAIVENNRADEAYFILVHHDGNEEIVNEWNSYFNLLSPALQNDLKIITASEIVNISSDPTYKKYFKDRYQL
jgi:hypothetical protein